MRKDWLKRARHLIETDGRSGRELSRLAGCGPNYASQFAGRGSKSVDDMMRLLDVLGPGAAIYVFTGLRLNSDDIQALRMLSGLDSETRHQISGILRQLSQQQFEPLRSPEGGEEESELL